MKKRAATEGAGTANDATVKMLKGLEGFRANFYDINGHKTIGMEIPPATRSLVEREEYQANRA